MSIITEFKKFINRGSVIDLAVGVIIGGAFQKIVSSLVENLIMPPIGMILNGINFTDFKIVLKAAEGENKEVAIKYGAFAQATIDFIIVAFCIFLLVKGINNLKKKEVPAPPAPPEPTAEEKLLTEIRDLLKK